MAENTPTGGNGTIDTAVNTAGDAGNTTVTTPNPTPVSLTDDALVTYEGAKEPVKFGNLRGLQSQFTKVSQAKSKLEQDLGAREARIKELEAAIQRASRSNQPQQANPLDKIRELPYLSGEEAAGVVGNVLQMIKQRDLAIRLMVDKYSKLEQVVNNLNQTHTTTAFDSKINRFLDQMGLDPEYAEDAKIFYLAHEGDGLDDEFVERYQRHLETRTAIEKKRQQRLAEKARSAPFVPGRGGVGQAAKPIDFAGMSPAEQAEIMFNAMNASDSQKT